KDGIFAVLSWLSILAAKNKDTAPGSKLVGVREVALEHWRTYGRNFFSRYDYEEVSSEDAAKVMDTVRAVVAASPKIALELSQLKQLTGREQPTVIT
ncbi:uncharacterized protein HaLaN_06582, partial [Haematococcus lacustris]